MTKYRTKSVPRHLKSVLIAAFMALACVFAAIALQNIHVAPGEPTLQQDRAELARLETQAHINDAHTAAPTPLADTASNSLTDRTSAQPKEQLQSKPNHSKPFSSRVPAARTTLALELKSSRKYQERQTERALQRQRVLASNQQRYAQQEPGSLFSSIARALGFSGEALQRSR